MKYWLYSDGNILGPYEPADLLAAPDFTEESLVCDEDSINAGHDDWKPASQFPEFAKILEPLAAGAGKPMEPPAEPAESAEEISDKISEESSLDDSGTVSGDMSDVPVSITDAEVKPAEIIAKPSDNPDGLPEIGDSPEPADIVPDIDGAAEEIKLPSIDEDLSEDKNKDANAQEETFRIPGNDISDLEKILNSKEFSLDSSDVLPKEDPADENLGLNAENIAEQPVADEISAAEPVEPEYKGDESLGDNTKAVPEETETVNANIENLLEDAETVSPVSDVQPSVENNSFTADDLEKTSGSEPGDMSMGDFLSSLQSVIGDNDDKKTGADKPPEEITDFQNEISQSLGETEKKKNVKEELDSLRLEKDLLLGQLSLNDLGQNDRKKRIDDLIQTLRVNARKTGGKSVFDDEMPEPQEAARQSLPVKENPEPKTENGQSKSAEQKFDEGFAKESKSSGDTPSAETAGQPAVETEIDDSDATAIKTPVKEKKETKDQESSYDVSGPALSDRHSPIYVYERPHHEYDPGKRESVTKVSFSDDFRSGQIDFNTDNEDEVLNLLPQQAGGMVYDFTALSGKPSKFTPSGSKSSVYAVKNVAISLDSSAEDKSSERRKVSAKASVKKTSREKAEFVSERVTGTKSSKNGTVSSSDSGETLPVLSGLSSSALSKSGRGHKHPAISEHEILRQQKEEGPILQEISQPHTKIEDQDLNASSELSSMDDEDRLKRETYEAILSGKDTALFKVQDENDDQTVSMMWDQSFNAENLLQAASIESIGKNSGNSSVQGDSNPFKAADIYSTPQQNVLADDFAIPQETYSSNAGEAESDVFLDIAPSADGSDQGLSDDFSDYYVDSVPGGQSVASSLAMSEDDMGSGKSLEDDAENNAQPDDQQSEIVNPKAKGPKIIKGIPASLSSIHRSIRTTRRKMEEGDSAAPLNDLDEMPDFNIQLSSLESNRVTIEDIAKATQSKSGETKHIETASLSPLDNDILSSDVNSQTDSEPAKEELPEEHKKENPETEQIAVPEEDLEEPPALQLGKPSLQEPVASALPEAELRPSLFKEPEPVAPAPAPVFYFDPSEKKHSGGAAVIIPSSGQMSSLPESSPSANQDKPDLVTVLSPRVKNENNNAEPVDAGAASMYQKKQSGKGRRLAIFALALICLVLFGALALFMLAGNKGGTPGTNIASAKTAEEEKDPLAGAISESGKEEESQSNVTPAEENPVPSESPDKSVTASPSDDMSGKEQEAEKTDEGFASEPASAPVTASDRISSALQIVKNYKLSGGRGTINNWFANAFLSSSSSNAAEWSATPLHEDIYVVQYRLPRSRQDPLIYQFEVDLAKQNLLRGINNNAIDLLDTGTTKTARAVPARNTYSSYDSSQKPEKNKESLLQKAKKTFAPVPKKQYKKTPEIKQLPLPPAPKKHYSQAVPTGFEQPEEDSNEAFLKAMESDEELF